MPYVFVALMIVFAGAYAYFRRSAALLSRLFFKATASIMFILVAVSARLGANEPYYTLILIGLCLAFAGDIVLVFTGYSRAYLIAGMAAFTGTYILYIIAFWTVAAPAWYEAFFFVLVIGVGVLSFHVRHIKTGSMSPAVYIYAVILCAMAARSFSMLLAPKVSPAFAICAAVGGVLLALSDMLLAFERFSNSFGRAAGAVSTAVYYSGQALIALTVML